VTAPAPELPPTTTGWSWEELHERYDGLVRATGRRYRLQPADVEEVAQTTWLRLLEHAGGVRDPERLAGWLATTASRESLRLLQRRRHEVSSDLVDLEGVPGDGPGEPGCAVLRTELQQAVAAAVDTLPPRWRALLRALAEVDHPCYAEVARRVAMPVGSIGPTRRRGLEHVRSALAAQGLLADV
jgi:RNA polymerase sigma factor (sigma-70 family)